jgi:hypothetical protein
MEKVKATTRLVARVVRMRNGVLSKFARNCLILKLLY